MIKCKVNCPVKTKIPTYVIGLDRHKGRLIDFTNEVQKHGVAFERISAIDAKSLSDADINQARAAMYPPRIKRKMSDAEVACFLSHMKVWKGICKGDAHIAMICEDDARFDSKIVDLMDALSDCEPHWDILRLYSHRRETPITTEALIEGVEAHVVEKITMSTVAYIITKPAAQHLLNVAAPISLPIDGYLKQWWVHGLCSKQVWPSIAMPAYTGTNHSTIEESRFRQRTKNPVVRLVRNLRFQWYLMRQRKKHIKTLTRSRQFL